MRFVQQQFFPKSDRPELLVDLTLPQSASLQGHAGGGRPRREAAQGRSRHRALELLCRPGRDPLLPAARRPARQRLLRPGRGRHQGLQAARAACRRGWRRRSRRTSTTCWRASRPLELGPPVGWPLKFRVSGPDAGKTRELAHAFAQVLGENANTRNINYDWNEPAKVIQVEVDQDRARALGISSQQLANNINAVLSGTTITQLRDAHLPDRHRRPRRARGARQARDAAQPDAGHGRRAQRAAGADRHALLRAGAAADLAPPAPADGDGAGRRGAGRRGDHGRQAARAARSPTSAPSCRPAMPWSLGGVDRGQRQGAGQHLRGVSAHAVPDGDHPDGAADELPAAVPGAADGAAGADRRGRGAAHLAARRWASSPSSASSR